MISLLLVTVILAPPFGPAEATAVEAGPPFVVQVTIEMASEPEAVLLRPISAGGELERVAMAPGEDGNWIGVLRLTERENLRVAFEALERDGTAALSEPSTLIQLGVDPAVFDLPEPEAPSGGRRTTAGTGWLAVAALAVVGALIAVAAWAWGGRRTVDDPPDEALLSGNLEHTGNPDDDAARD